MANQRANIYPIQLQGAELNLNKFDGEIKQYSGFNKNNSPFVGGGLSPIFRKDETVEGATSKNTYIAPNGDVYRVDYSGFYKNDVKIIDYNNGNSPSTLEANTHAGFIDCDVLPKYQNGKRVIWYYTDKVYLYKENGHFYVNGIDLGVPNIFYTDEQVATELITCVNVYNRSIVCAFIAGTFIYAVFNSSGNLIRTQTVTTSYTEDFSEDVVNMTIFASDGDDNNYTAVFSCLNSSNERKIVAFNIVYSSNTWNVQPVMELNDTLVISSSSTNYKAASYSLSDYHFCSYPENRIYAKHTQDYDNGNTDTTLAIAFGVNPSCFANSNITVSFSGLTGVRNLNITHVNKIVKSSENNALLDLEYQEAFFTSQFCSYVFQAFINNNYDTIAFGVNCSSAFSVNKVNDMTRVKTSLGFVAPIYGEVKRWNRTFNLVARQPSAYTLLFNGNKLSGIGMYVGGLLLSDWNNVSSKYIGFICGNTRYETPSVVTCQLVKTREDSICFKQGDNFYFVHPGTPKLKVINNQIITNVYTWNHYREDIYTYIDVSLIPNSWLVSEEKTLFFGIRFNNAFKGSTLTFSQNAENDLFVAASVNEYKRQDNSSIIINPTHIISLNKPPVISEYVNDVNYYEGKDEVIYKTSFRRRLNNSGVEVITSYINNDLLNLPFPSNSDGNVEYSPNIFSEVKSLYGNDAFIKSGNTFYPLAKDNNKTIMSFFLASGIDDLDVGFIIQGQFYGIINNNIYSLQYQNGVITNVSFVVSVEGLQFVGNTPYEALFFSKTNRCLYSFVGANILNAKQLVDKISEVRNYKYNPATQSIFLITDIGVIVYSLFGIYQIEFLNCHGMYLLNNGVVLTDNEGTFKYVKYYKEETTEDYTKENIQLETMFYGVNNQTVTINDCLYMRIFSEEHEEGNLEVSATTLSLEGRMTEKTTFKIKESDWDKMTHTIYLRYQPKEQRGLGISFSINSPFKICSLSVGSIADSILIDKVSKGAINAPYNNKSSIEEW